MSIIPLASNEYISEVKIKGLLPECVYGIYFNLGCNVTKIPTPRDKRHYEVSNAKTLTLNHYCDCKLSKIAFVTVYCVKR
jgi:hypothetical protein